MVYTDELVRVSVIWTAESSSTWQPELAMTTFHLRHHHFTGNGFDWDTNINDLPGQLKSKFDAHWGGIGSHHSNQVAITQIKCAHIDAAGHDLQAHAVDITDDSLQGLSSNTLLPPEVAVVLSEYCYEPGTFAAHKGRKRGRMYLPYLQQGLTDAHGKVSAGAVASVLADWASFVNDVQGMHTSDFPIDDPHDYWDWVIASKIDATWMNVGWVAVDNHFDVQRRRQHQSPPTRSTAVISHA